MADYQIF